MGKEESNTTLKLSQVVFVFIFEFHEEIENFFFIKSSFQQTHSTLTDCDKTHCLSQFGIACKFSRSQAQLSVH